MKSIHCTASGDPLPTAKTKDFRGDYTKPMGTILTQTSTLGDRVLQMSQPVPRVTTEEVASCLHGIKNIWVK